MIIRTQEAHCDQSKCKRRLDLGISHQPFVLLAEFDWVAEIEDAHGDLLPDILTYCPDHNTQEKRS